MIRVMYKCVWDNETTDIHCGIFGPNKNADCPRSIFHSFLFVSKIINELFVIIEVSGHGDLSAALKYSDTIKWRCRPVGWH